MKGVFDAEDYGSKRIAANFNERGVGDICFGEAYNRHIMCLKLRALRRALRRHRPRVQGQSALDAGTGTGLVLRELQYMGVRAAGLDLASTSVERLRRELPGTEIFQGMIGSPLPRELKGRAFDLVASFDVLFHITDEERARVAVRQLAGLTAPGGLLLVNDLLGSRPLRVAQHVCFWHKNLYEEELTAAGLCVREVSPVYFLMNSSNLFTRRLLSVKLLGLAAFAVDMLLAPLAGHFTRRVRLLVAEREQ
jgi:SAM-dependent methyltransferase